MQSGGLETARRYADEHMEGRALLCMEKRYVRAGHGGSDPRRPGDRDCPFMSQAVGEVLAFGIGVALSPVAVIAVVLMLAAPGGRVTATVFLASWALSLGAVATLALLLADSADARQDGAPADWVIAVQIALAVLLLAVAAWQWRGRGDHEVKAELPAWMQKVDGLTTPRAAGMAVFLAGVKPKNLLLTIGAAVAVAELGVSAGAQAGALAVFVLLGTLAPGIPLAVSLLMRERGAAILVEMRSWMVRENRTIVASSASFSRRSCSETRSLAQGAERGIALDENQNQRDRCTRVTRGPRSWAAPGPPESLSVGGSAGTTALHGKQHRPARDSAWAMSQGATADHPSRHSAVPGPYRY